MGIVCNFVVDMGVTSCGWGMVDHGAPEGASNIMRLVYRIFLVRVGMTVNDFWMQSIIITWKFHI